MKTVGIVREVDSLGRIVIPMEMRKVLGIQDRTPVEISLSSNGIISLQKYVPKPSIETKLDELSAMLEDPGAFVHNEDAIREKVAEVRSLILSPA